jgi:hypothetical protein
MVPKTKGQGHVALDYEKLEGGHIAAPGGIVRDDLLVLEAWVSGLTLFVPVDSSSSGGACS